MTPERKLDLMHKLVLVVLLVLAFSVGVNMGMTIEDRIEMDPPAPAPVSSSHTLRPRKDSMYPDKAVAWPWFKTEERSFSKAKLSRVPNRCLFCGNNMIDIGTTQIIYSCQNPHCADYRGPQYLHHRTQKPCDPYLSLLRLLSRKGFYLRG